MRDDDCPLSVGIWAMNLGHNGIGIGMLENHNNGMAGMDDMVLGTGHRNGAVGWAGWGVGIGQSTIFRCKMMRFDLRIFAKLSTAVGG